MRKNWHHIVLVVGFILCLCLPAVVMLCSNNKEVPAGENIKGIDMSTFATPGKSNRFLALIQKIPEIKEYYSHHLVYINELLAIFRYIKSSLFSVNPFPEKVVLGTNNWYFLGNSFSDVIKETKGITFFSEPKLAQIEDSLCTIREDCNRRGIKLYITVAPDKSSVYGQYLPIIKSDHPTKLDQLITRMKRHQMNIIDLKRDFHLYSDKRLFYLHDTHWNVFGSFIGYRTLMDYIIRDFPDLKVNSVNDFELDTLITEDNDLTGMLSLKIPEDMVVMKPKNAQNARLKTAKLPLPDYYTGTPAAYEIRILNPTCRLKVLVFRDSFFNTMIPFIKESFKKSVFIWTGYDRCLLDIVKPDLVIYELVERDIDDFKIIHP